MDKRALSQGTVALIVFAFFLASFLQARNEPHFRSAQWRIAGQDLSNSWNQPAERRINVANVDTLAPKWVFTTGSDVQTPSKEEFVPARSSSVECNLKVENEEV